MWNIAIRNELYSNVTSFSCVKGLKAALAFKSYMCEMLSNCVYSKEGKGVQTFVTLCMKAQETGNLI